jgi:hypothetical protein
LTRTARPRSRLEERRWVDARLKKHKI